MKPKLFGERNDSRTQATSQKRKHLASREGEKNESIRKNVPSNCLLNDPAIRGNRYRLVVS